MTTDTDFVVYVDEDTFTITADDDGLQLLVEAVGFDQTALAQAAQEDAEAAAAAAAVSAAAAAASLAALNAVLAAAWATYTPTVTPNAGAITTVTSSGAYKLIGKTCFVFVTYNITSLGTATGDINLTFPPGVTPIRTNVAGNGYITTTDAACVVKISTIPSLQFIAGSTAQARSATFVFETT